MLGKVTFDECVNALEMYWKGDISYTVTKNSNIIHSTGPLAFRFFSVSNCVKFDISMNEDVKMQRYSRRMGKCNILIRWKLNAHGLLMAVYMVMANPFARIPQLFLLTYAYIRPRCGPDYIVTRVLPLLGTGH